VSILVLGVVAPFAAHAFESCGAAYHQALAGPPNGALKMLSDAFKAARTTEPNWSGRWVFADRPNATKPEPEPKVCAEAIKKAGRTRCVRWEAKPAPERLVSTIKPTFDELSIFKAVDDVIVGKGALSEFGPSGRNTFAMTRIITDLRAYITQPANPALCSGAPQYLTFLKNQTKSLEKRADDAKALAAKASDAARAATLAVLSSALEGERAESTAPDRVSTPVAQLMALVGVLVTDEGLENVKAATQPIEKLYAVAEAVRSSPRAEVAPGLRAASLSALRIVEASLVANHVAGHHAGLRAFTGATFEAIAAAHTEACTCPE
jgi:hypothetical protein